MVLVFVLLHAGILGILVANYVYLRKRVASPLPSDLPRVSVLIPARNEAANLRRLLPSLLWQDYPDYEVIVYDDGSEDDTWTVLRDCADPRLRVLRGSGPPEGWIGKVYALYQATRAATGRLYLFLDADAELLDHGALARLVQRYASLTPESAMTGFVRLRGGGQLLVSLVPNAILSGLPWPLVRRLRLRSLGALNGQCWMVDARTYHRLEPHEHVRDEVLEDVLIGRYFLERGVLPVLVDVQGEVAVHMYESFGDAWRGFRKNAYLILGGRPLSFVVLGVLYFSAYVLPPFFAWWLLGPIVILKGFTDRLAGFPWWITLCAPLSYLLGTILQLDSALAHWTGRVSWKGRRVGTHSPSLR